MHEIISFAVLWFFLTIPLGPNAIISIDTSIQYGWPRALLVPLGITLASIIYSLLSITVLPYILNLAPTFFKFAVLLGSLYLFYLGCKILIRPALKNGDAPKDINGNQLIFLGFTTSLSNPKAALVYLSVLPSIAHSKTMEPIIIITIACVIVFFVYFFYSWFAKLFRSFVIGFPYRQKFIDVLACLSFLLIAAKNIHYVITQSGGVW